MSDQSDMAEVVGRRLESAPVPVADIVQEVRMRWGPEHGVSAVHGFVREVATCLLWSGEVEVGDVKDGVYRTWRIEPEDADARLEAELLMMSDFLMDRSRL